MIDYQSLFEFDESLGSSSQRESQILLNNLELKIECSKFDEEVDTTTEEFTENDLQKLFDEYKFSDDEFSTCCKCGRSLTDESMYKSCCKSYVKNNSCIGSGLEVSYWLSFINNPSRTINTLPNYTEFLCLQQGIPNQIRSTIWRKSFLLNSSSIPQTSVLVYKNFQHSYNVETSHQISKDLNRTFPAVEFFKSEETIKNLSTILNVYANYDVELGYCQGLLFLVGVLYYQFHGNSEMTFHALINIMESENELHDIFTASTMYETLNAWHSEFLNILKVTDKELYTHLTSFVDLKPFLYQWWLSFASSHSPDLSIVNRIMDFCIFEGWKTGLLKISLGLLISNKPILMCVEEGDEEVIYQHLLNESKWGNVINDLDLFFGDLLLNWDDSLFIKSEQTLKRAASTRAAKQSIVGKLKNLSLNFRDRSDSASTNNFNHSSSSVFSHQNNNSLNNHAHTELESIYSDISEVSSENNKSFSDYLKLLKRPPSGETAADKLLVENLSLKALLKQAYDLLDDNQVDSSALKSEIIKVVNV